MQSILLKKQVLLLLLLQSQMWNCSVMFLESKKYLPLEEGKKINLYPYIDKKSFHIGGPISFFIDFTFKDVLFTRNFSCEEKMSCYRTGEISDIIYNKEKIKVEKIRLFLGLSKLQSSSFYESDIGKIAVLEAYHEIENQSLIFNNIVGLNQQSKYANYISKVYILKENFMKIVYFNFDSFSFLMVSTVNTNYAILHTLQKGENETYEFCTDLSVEKELTSFQNKRNIKSQSRQMSPNTLSANNTNIGDAKVVLIFSNPHTRVNSIMRVNMKLSNMSRFHLFDATKDIHNQIMINLCKDVNHCFTKNDLRQKYEEFSITFDYRDCNDPMWFSETFVIEGKDLIFIDGEGKVDFQFSKMGDAEAVDQMNLFMGFFKEKLISLKFDFSKNKVMFGMSQINFNWFYFATKYSIACCFFVVFMNFVAVVYIIFSKIKMKKTVNRMALENMHFNEHFVAQDTKEVNE